MREPRFQYNINSKFNDPNEQYRLLWNESRWLIMRELAREPEGAYWVELLHLLKLNDGQLYSSIRTLKKVGFVTTFKNKVKNYPRAKNNELMVVAITEKGADAFDYFNIKLKELLKEAMQE